MKSQFTKYRVLSLCLLTVSMAGLIPSIGTAATTISHSQFRGLTANLFFESTSGSISSEVFVSATQGQANTPSVLNVNVTETDSLLGQLFNGCANVPLTSSQIQFTRVANNLVTASLNITGLALQDCMTRAFITTADVAIAWTAFGPSSKTRDNLVFRSGSFTLHSHSDSIQRDANVAGSLIVNGTDLLAGVTAADYSANLQQSGYINIDMTKSF